MRDDATLGRCLTALARMVDEGRLATDDGSVGVELEVALVDTRLAPAMRNQAVLDASGSDLLTAELGSWNVEINLPPRGVAEAADGALERDLVEVVGQVDAAARRCGARAVTVGILPTLEAEHLASSRITDEDRYARLNEQLTRARGEPFEIDITATTGERLELTVESVAAEAACTSFQLHLQLSPESLPAYWNAAQAIAGVQVALAANSPFLLGRRLWAETRVPLFTQAVDTRSAAQRAQGAPPRVWFGDHWASRAHELFDGIATHFDVLLPVDDGVEDPIEVLDRGEVPALAELCSHLSTVWQWNRPVYDVATGSAHLRLENRVLPAAPTGADAAADAMFFYGLVRALAEQHRPVWREMTVPTAEANLGAGARDGIDATLWWPGRGPIAVTDLVADELVPLAAGGLASWGVDPGAARRHLAVIEGRCRTRRNGATWQTDVVSRLERRGHTRGSALQAMLHEYLRGGESRQPVHTWPTS